MRTFAVDIPVSNETALWIRITVKAETGSMAREIAVMTAEDEGHKIDITRRINATWTD
jgi:hypothetical protein